MHFHTMTKWHFFLYVRKRGKAKNTLAGSVSLAKLRVRIGMVNKTGKTLALIEVSVFSER